MVVVSPAPARRSLAESLPPSCRKLLAEAAVLEAVDAAGFLPWRGNTVWWGDGEGRSEAFADGEHGYQVPRNEFDALLLRQAVEAGAELRRGRVSPPGSLEPFDGEGGEAPQESVRLRVVPATDATATRGGAGGDGPRASTGTESGGGDPRASRPSASGGEGRRPESLPVRYVLDCSGRAGVLARRVRRPEAGQRTLALVGVWRRAGGWGLDDDTHTLVESFEDGWAWSVPVSREVRYFTFMVDPEASELGRGARLQRYLAEVARTRRLRALLETAELQAQPWGCDASLYDSERFGGARFLLVGDAASFIDPLSSFGVKKALASAWLAAVVVHTCLRHPDRRAAALQLFEAQERRMYDAYRRRSAAHFQDAALFHDHPFWRRRASADPMPTGALDADALRTDPEVLAAFDALKASPTIRLRRGADVRFLRVPAVVGREIAFEEALATPSVPQGVRFLRGVDLLRLVAMAGRHTRVPALFDAYNRSGVPVALPDFLGALSVLVAKGFLRDESSPK